MISILMPVKNAGQYLSNCLDSILSQTYRSWELIAVDDFSEDESVSILERYAQRDSRIKVLKNQKAGIIPAIQLAFSHAQGTWISRMDADDLMPEQKLALFMNQAREKTILTGNVKYFSDDKVSGGYQRYERWLNELEPEDYDKQIYRECVIASPNWLISRQFFEKFDWSQWQYPEDYDLVFHWRKAGYRVHKIDQFTHLWREHPTRTSRNSERYQQTSFFRLKTHWFLASEWTEGETLQLVGSSQKMNLVANVLDSRHVSYERFSVKEGVGSSVKDLDPNRKAILCAWPANPKTQTEIRKFLEDKGFGFGRNLWLF